LHQGLGVPSLPYGHIYHSAVGLVEELKLNKNVFNTFEEILATYVRGSCVVTYTDTAGENVDDSNESTDPLEQSNLSSFD
jgi:hypothetical protein